LEDAPAEPTDDGAGSGGGVGVGTRGGSECKYYCTKAFSGKVDPAKIECGAESLFDSGFEPLKCDSEPTNKSSCIACIEAMGATGSACKKAYEMCW
jgi:hypothetical protein